MRIGIILAGWAMLLAGSVRAEAPAIEPIIHPAAVTATAPMPDDGDAADDPAIWVHPSDPELSLILGTNKKGGLHVYDLSGVERQIVSPDAHPDNVDVLRDFGLNGVQVDLAVAGCRSSRAPGLKIWSIDPKTRKLSDVTVGGTIPTFGGTEPYGSCVYRSARTGRAYAFVNNHRGFQEQYELLDAGGGKVGGKLVRSFRLKSITEGCVADDERGVVFIAEERVGVWRFNAEPDAPDADKGVLIARVGEHGLTADVEGLTLYKQPGGQGYLLVSSQGSDSFIAYDRDGDHAFAFTMKPRPGELGAPSDTDGIDSVSAALGPRYPQGMLVVQDGRRHGGGRQRFLVYSWAQILGAMSK